MKEKQYDLRSIGCRIRELRTEYNLTQEELANKVGVARGTINYWEKGSREPKIGDVVRLAHELNTSCDYLLLGVQTENLSLHKEIGLNDSSIRQLKELNKESPVYIDTLDFLLASKDFTGTMYHLLLSRDHLHGAKNLSIKSCDLMNSLALRTGPNPIIEITEQEKQTMISDLKIKTEKYNKRIEKQIEKAEYEFFLSQKAFSRIFNNYRKELNIVLCKIE